MQCSFVLGSACGQMRDSTFYHRPIPYEKFPKIQCMTPVTQFHSIGTPGARLIKTHVKIHVDLQGFSNVASDGLGLCCHPTRSLVRESLLSKVNYCDVIMGAVASQINSLTIVYSTDYSDADQRKHQSSASLAFVRVIHRGPLNSPHKGPVTQKMFPFDDVIMHVVDVFHTN